MNENESKFVQILIGLENNCDREYSLISYSGRGMYGKNCVAITVSENDIGKFFADFLFEVQSVHSGEELEDLLDEYAFCFENMQVDNMGLGMVYYFPKIDVDEARKVLGWDPDRDEN